MAEKTIDEMFAEIPEDHRAALERLRVLVRAAEPDAEEGISYGLAAFRLDGKPLAGFGASAKHCAFYPMSGSIVTQFAKELTNYETSKGAIRFTVDKPLSATLVRKLVKARAAEIAAPKAKPKKPSAVAKAIDNPMTRDQVFAWLERKGSQKVIDKMARYGIETKLRTFGVAMGTLLTLKKQLGKNHDLAVELWASGCYEARLLAALIGDAERFTRSSMNAWAADFETWADCDTVVFHLFDRTPYRWEKVHQWAKSPHEYVKRAAFWMMATLTVHDKAASDDQFFECLPLIEKGASDERHFVKKAVNCALRGIGKRSVTLNAAAIEVAQRLAASNEPPARWIGKDALREIGSAKVRARFAKRAK